MLERQNFIRVGENLRAFSGIGGKNAIPINRPELKLLAKKSATLREAIRDLVPFMQTSREINAAKKARKAAIHAETMRLSGAEPVIESEAVIAVDSSDPAEPAHIEQVQAPRVDPEPVVVPGAWPRRDEPVAKTTANAVVNHKWVASDPTKRLDEPAQQPIERWRSRGFRELWNDFKGRFNKPKDIHEMPSANPSNESTRANDKFLVE